jgi:hypothetical protein
MEISDIYISIAGLQDAAMGRVQDLHRTSALQEHCKKGHAMSATVQALPISTNAQRIRYAAVEIA